MAGSWKVPGAAPELFVVGGTPLLHAEEQMFEAMLSGWSDQQTARNLHADTVADRARSLRRFQRFTGEWPWAWRPVDVEEFTTELRGEGRSRATTRAYQGALRQFLDYVCDPRYQWTAACERLFGTHPTQICFEWNTALHATDYEARPGRRALTRAELQALFDHADDQVAAARTSGRKGWLTAMRDAVALKTAYAWGLRRRELAMLELADFGRNPHATEFGDHGVIYVRWGKASKGSAPKRRSVLTVFPWSVTVVDEWLSGYRDLFPTAERSSSLWPTERGARLTLGAPQRPVRRLPRPARTPPRARTALPAPLLCHAPDRGRLRRPLRPTAGRALPRLDHRALHLGQLGLPHPHPAPRPGRDRGCCLGGPTTVGAGVREETRWPASLTSSGTCASSWPPTTSGRPPSSSRCWPNAVSRSRPPRSIAWSPTSPSGCR